MHMLSTIEAASHLGVAPKTLENWRTTGFGPRFVKAGRRVVYEPSDIATWKVANRYSSTSEIAHQRSEAA